MHLREKFTTTLGIFIASLLLLSGVILPTAMMHRQMGQTSANQTVMSDCQLACRSPLLPIALTKNSDVTQRKRPSLLQDIPYGSQLVLALLPVGILAIILRRHLRWKPPDLFKLCSSYRI